MMTDERPGTEAFETVPDDTEEMNGMPEQDEQDDGVEIQIEDDPGIASEPEPEDEQPEEPQEESAAEPEKPSPEDESLNNRYLRLMADFQNFRKRVEKEKSDVYAYANEKIMTDLLQVLDNFGRALAQECSDEAYAKGMDLIYKQFTDVLGKSGLEEIDPLGEDFDPNFHHAVLTDDNDEYESGKVTMVMQKGYKLNDRVIRPAMVRVNN